MSRISIFLLVMSLLSSPLQALERIPGVFTYQGRAYQSDGTTPLVGNATFSVQIRSANGNCLLYQETHGGIDLTASAGLFAINIGDGSAKSGLDLTSVFSNVSQPKATLSGTCGGTYTPANQDPRVLRITVNVGSPVVLEDQYIYSVPKALVADSLNGYTYNQFVQHLTTTQRNALTSMVNGTTIYNITTGRFNRYNGATWTEAFGATSVGTGSSIYKGKMAGNDWLELRSILGGSGISVTQNTNDLTLAIDPTYTQRRITGTCSAGNFITGVNQDGTVVCAADATGGGGGAVAGDGTTISGDGTAGSEFAVIPAGIDIATLSGQITMAQLPTCANDQILKMNGANWNCEADGGAGGGGLTTVATDGTTINGDGDATPIYLMDGAVTTVKIGDDQVTAAKIADGAIDALAKLGAMTCTANQILKRNVGNTAWECAADTDTGITSVYGDTFTIEGSGSLVDPLKVVAGGIGTTQLADDGVTAAKIADGAIDDLAKFAALGCTANQIIKRNAGNTAWECAADSGGTTYTAGNGLSLTGAAFSINTTDISSCTNTTSQKIVWDSSNNRLICATDAGASGGLSSTLNSAQVYVGDSGNTAVARTLTGDVTINNTGVTAIANSAVTTIKINDDAVTAAKLADGAIDATAKLAAGLCTDGQILKKVAGVWACAADEGGISSVSVSAPITGDGVGTPLDIATGGIDTAELADDAVTTIKIGDDQVTADKIADGAIDALAKLGAMTCTANQILKRNVGNTAWECAADAAGSTFPAMTNAQIIVSNGTTPTAVSMSADVTIAASGATTIANNAVTTVKINDDAVTAAKIADGAIDNLAKLGNLGCGDGQVLKWSTAGAGSWSCQNDAGAGGGSENTSAINVGTGADVFKAQNADELQFRTIASNNTVTITENTNDISIAVNEANLDLANIGGDLNLATQVTGALALTNLANCPADQILQQNVSGTAWTCVPLPLDADTTYSAGNGLSLSGTSFSINTTDIASCTNTTNQKIVWDSSNNRLICATDAGASGGLSSALNSAQIYVGDSGNTAVARTLTGDVTINNTGVTAIANDAVTTVKIDDDAVTTAKIGDDQVTAAKLADGAIDATAKLAAGLCTDGQILKKVAGVWACAADTGGMTSVNVSAPITGDGATTPLDIAAGGIDTAELADDAVTTVKIADDAVTTIKIGDDQVTAAKIADGAIDNVAKLAVGLCAANQILKKNAGNTAWECAADAGGITTVNVSAPLTGDGVGSPIDVSVDGTSIVVNGSDQLSVGSITTTHITDGTIALADLSNFTCTGNQTIRRNAGNTAWECFAPSTGGSESTTVTNVGTGSGIYKDMSATQINLKSITAGSAKVTVTANTNDVALDVDESELDLANIGGDLDLATQVSGALPLTNLANCPPDQILQQNVSGTAWTCVPLPLDTNTTYTAGHGLSLTTTSFSINTTDIASCTNTTNQKIVWDSSNNRLICATDAGASGGLSSALNSAQIYVGDSGNTAVARTLTGDVTINNTGVTAIANSAVTTVKINDGAVTTVKIGDDQVTADKIADGAIDALAKLGAMTCTANQILKRNVGNTAWECAADATGTALPAMTNAQIIVSNGTTPTAVAMSGDVTIAASGATTIANNAVTTVKIGDDQVTAAKIADGAIDDLAKLASTLCAANQVLKKRSDNTGWECAADAAGTGDITDVIAGNGLTDGGTTGSVTLNVGAGHGITVAADAVAINTTDIATCTNTTNQKIVWDSTNNRLICATDAGASGGLSSTLNEGQIYVGDNTNTAVARTPAGDVTMTNAGSFTIANNAVTTVKINDGAVTSAKIADGAIDSLEKFGLSALSCAAGEVLQWTIPGWACTELPSGGIDGSGTANSIPKWSDTDTLTNSPIVTNASNTRVSVGAELNVTGDTTLSNALSVVGTSNLQGEVTVGNNILMPDGEFSFRPSRMSQAEVDNMTTPWSGCAPMTICLPGQDGVGHLWFNYDEFKLQYWGEHKGTGAALNIASEAYVNDAVNAVAPTGTNHRVAKFNALGLASSSIMQDDNTNLTLLGTAKYYSTTLGSATTPAYSIAGDTNTGMYSAAADNLNFATAGVNRLGITTTAVSSTLPFYAQNGTAAAPAMTFTSDPNTGIYSNAADTIGFTAGGVVRARIGTAGLTLAAGGTISEFSTDGTLGGNSNTSVPTEAAVKTYVDGRTVASTASGTANRLVKYTSATAMGNSSITDNGTTIAITTPMQGALGAVGTPTYSFSGDPNTGMYSSAADTLNFTTGGVSRVALNTTSLTSTLPFYAQNGTMTAPAFTFASDTNTGIYRGGADNLTLVAGGNAGINVSATGAQVNGLFAVSGQVINIAGEQQIKVGLESIFVGGSAGITSGSMDSTAVGYYALSNAPGTSSNNVAVGAYSLWNVGASSPDNTAVGTMTMAGGLMSQVTGNQNVAIGSQSMHYRTAMGTGNIAVGHSSMNSTGTATSNYNIGIGHSAMAGTWSGTNINNIAIGRQALDSNLNNANGNVAIGFSALGAATSGASTIAIGNSAMSNSAGGNYITVLGASAAPNVTGNWNTVLGYGSAAALTSGTSNVIMGNYDTAKGITTGASNVIIGGTYTFDGATTSSSNNIILGNMAARNMTGISNSNIVIGGGPASTAAYTNQLFIHNGTDDAPTIHGNMTTKSVGIGRQASTYNFEVQGTVGKTSAGTTWNVISDARLKENVHNYEYGLDEILKLRTVRYKYKDDNPAGMDSTLNHIGFIAQEVQPIFPEAVTMRPQGYYDLNVDPILWASVNAIQELNGKCEMSKQQSKAIEARMTSAERRIASLEEKNQKLENENKALRSDIEKIKKALNIK